MPEELDVAPDFTLVDTNDETVRLSDYRGRYVYLVFNRGFS
jgi:peroxiredoxin